MWWIILALLLLALSAIYLLLRRENPRLKLDLIQRNPTSIYDRAGTERIFSPVSIGIDPMKHMVIADFNGHDLYQAVELQIFDHPDKGQGANLLLWRKDTGKTDFYFEPTVKMDREQANVAGGVGNWTETHFDYHYNISDAGIDAAAKLTDLDGREIGLRIKENRRDKRPYLNMLAPMGGGIENPTFLPFFYMHGMDLVRRNGTEFAFTIDGKSYLPDALPPVPHNLAPTYFTRYCGDPFIATVNQDTNGPLQAIDSTRVDDTSYTLIDNDGHREIQRVTQEGDGHSAHITFAPPMPDISALKDGASVKGRFAIGTDTIESVIVGDYTVTCQGEKIDMSMHPTEDWWPRTGGLRAKGTFLFFPAIFRQWMQTYHWSAEMQRDANDIYMQSHWERREMQA